jgi:hypothetical protein
MGDKMDYVVAADDDNATGVGYMTPFKQNGIPHAFIVDKQSRVVWHGHPMGGLDQALDELLAGKFDLDSARQRAAAQTKLQEYYQLLGAGGDEARITALEKELVELDAKLGGISPGQKFDPEQSRQRVSFNRVIREYQKAFAEDPGSAKTRELEDQLRTGAPAGFDLAEFKVQLAAQVAFTAYMKEAMVAGNKDTLAELGRRLETAAGTNANALNELAWTLLTDENIKQRDLALASRLAKAAYDACGGKQASIVDTYARALFDTGKVAEAIQMQKQAVALCENDELRKTLETNLKTFEAKAAKP